MFQFVKGHSIFKVTLLRTLICTVGLLPSLLFISLANGQVPSSNAASPFVPAATQPERPARTFKDCFDCPEMVVVPAGFFEMGSTDAEVSDAVSKVPAGNGPLGLLGVFGWGDHQIAQRSMAYEIPKHLVTIHKEFAIGQSPVTRKEFAAFVRETHYETGLCLIFGHTHPIRRSNSWANPDYKQTERDPVVCVTWEDAQAYISWLNLKTSQASTAFGKRFYRLPSEAEWEYAARAGSKTQYFWGDQIGTDNASCANCSQIPASETSPVGAFPVNAFGLYDMSGNVAKFTADCWHENYIDAPSDGSAWLSANCLRRTERGGSWRGLAWAARSTARWGGSQSEVIYDRGFRVVKEIE